MPIYEYLCEKCGSRIEKLQKISDPLFTECEQCGGKLNKILSQSSFVLKGTGWYLTDYAKKSGASGPSDTSTSASTSTESSSSTDTNSKSEAKPASSSGGAETSGAKTE